MNLSTSAIALNVMSPYEPYQLGPANASAVRPLADQTLVALPAASAASTGPLEGLSAVGWVDQTTSLFVPVLEVTDCHGRSVGWGVSVVVNQNGSHFPNANWILSGVTTPAFYETPIVLSAVASLIANLSATDQPVVWARAVSFTEAVVQRAVAAATAVWPLKPGFVQGGRHLTYASDGSRCKSRCGIHAAPSPSIPGGCGTLECVVCRCHVQF